ncbi:acyltransferase family protein [Streptosporangium sp. NPDC000396]|uniref:acyltransferase family protein n=1 Tax=Streptosporangium sp. NPDC000396 TaxID=3366185 RepID=UPI00369B1D95
MTVTESASRLATRARERFAILDGIRGICAVSILTTHVAFATIVLSKDAGPPRAGFFSIIAIGLEMAIGPFFILSGLLLYRPFARMTIAGTPRPALGQFFARRVARLLPAFWLVTTFCLLALNFSLIQGVWDVLRPFALLHVYDSHYYVGLDVDWTVPAEAQFYLLLPLFAWFMHRIAGKGTDPVRKARRMMIPLGVLVLIQLGWAVYIHWKYTTWGPQFFYPFTVIGLWAIGMALAIWSVVAEVAPEKAPAFHRLAARRPNLYWLAALVVYAIVCAQPFAVPGTADWKNSPAAFVEAATVLLFSFLVMAPLVVPGASSRLMRTVLENRPMLFLGRVSYGIYLWHFVVMYLWFGSGSIFGEIVPVQTLLGKYGFWELEIPVLIGTVAVATLSYYAVEQPITRLTSRMIKARAARNAAPGGIGIPRQAESPSSMATID